MISLSKARFCDFSHRGYGNGFFWDWLVKLHDNSFQTPYSVSVGNFFEVRFQLIMLCFMRKKILLCFWFSISIFWVFFVSDNAIPIKSWFNDPTDTALLNLLPVLDALRFVSDVRSVLSRNREANRLWWVLWKRTQVSWIPLI